MKAWKPVSEFAQHQAIKCMIIKVMKIIVQQVRMALIKSNPECSFLLKKYL